MFQLSVNAYLEQHGFKIDHGTIISTPSTKNQKNEIRLWGDAAYTGQGEVIRAHAPIAKDFTHKKA